MYTRKMGYGTIHLVCSFFQSLNDPHIIQDFRGDVNRKMQKDYESSHNPSNGLQLEFFRLHVYWDFLSEREGIDEGFTWKPAKHSLHGQRIASKLISMLLNHVLLQKRVVLPFSQGNMVGFVINEQQPTVPCSNQEVDRSLNQYRFLLIYNQQYHLQGLDNNN